MVDGLKRVFGRLPSPMKTQKKGIFSHVFPQSAAYNSFEFSRLLNQNITSGDLTAVDGTYVLIELFPQPKKVIRSQSS